MISMMRAGALAGLLILPLGACSVFGGGPKTGVVAATPTSITLRFKEGELEDATKRAQNLCAQKGLTAQMQTVTPGTGDERVGHFECVPPT